MVVIGQGVTVASGVGQAGRGGLLHGADGAVVARAVDAMRLEQGGPGRGGRSPDGGAE